MYSPVLSLLRYTATCRIIFATHNYSLYFSRLQIRIKLVFGRLPTLQLNCSNNFSCLLQNNLPRLEQYFVLQHSPQALAKSLKYQTQTFLNSVTFLLPSFLYPFLLLLSLTSLKNVSIDSIKYTHLAHCNNFFFSQYLFLSHSFLQVPTLHLTISRARNGPLHILWFFFCNTPWHLPTFPSFTLILHTTDPFQGYSPFLSTCPGLFGMYIDIYSSYEHHSVQMAMYSKYLGFRTFQDLLRRYPTNESSA